MRVTALRLIAILALATVVLIGRVAPRSEAGRKAVVTDASFPEVPIITFGAPREWRLQPSHIAMGDSACAPYFSKLRWVSYGATGARARGIGLFPRLKPYPDSCDAALMRARPKRTRLVLSRPRYCEGHLTFTRIGWRARSEHAHYTTSCE